MLLGAFPPGCRDAGMQWALQACVAGTCSRQLQRMAPEQGPAGLCPDGGDRLRQSRQQVDLAARAAEGPRASAAGEVSAWLPGAGVLGGHLLEGEREKRDKVEEAREF